MWPYSKIKDTEPEIVEAECPICTGPTTAEHYEDGTIITNTCSKCRKETKPAGTEGDTIER